MAYAVGAALTGASIVALTLIPALAWLAFRKPRKVFHNPVIDALSVRYAGLLARTVGKTRWLVATCAAALGLLVLFSTIGRDLMPYLDEGSLWLQVQMPPGITLNKASAMANELRRVTLAFPEVCYMVTQTGRNDDGTDDWTPSHIEASVGLRSYKEWKSGLNKQERVNPCSCWLRCRWRCLADWPRCTCVA